MKHQPLSDGQSARLVATEALYQKHLPGKDRVAERSVWAAYAANQHLAGDPVWLTLVSGPSSGKTERVMPLSGLPGVQLISEMSGPAALLSASPMKDRAENATGGALMAMGGRGVLVMKDFTTVISMHRDKRAEVLAAFREIYDGKWSRHYGSDGGQVVSWEGKCGLIAACTPAIDSAYAVLNEMGPRSLFVRMDPIDPVEMAGYALRSNGGEVVMREELSKVTFELLSDPQGEPHEVGRVLDSLMAAASLAAVARTPIDRDNRHHVSFVHEVESSARVAKQLAQLWRGCGIVGLAPQESWKVIERAAIDSIPKLRRSIVSILGKRATAARPLDTVKVARLVKHNIGTARTPVQNALEDLQLHGVVEAVALGGTGNPQGFYLSEQARQWYDLTVLPKRIRFD